MIGQTVSHYRILERLGSGGMGVVYKAEDTQLHRFVALKFLPADSALDQQSIDRLRREARAASALNHAHICTIYEIGEHEGKPFLAMEFLDGLNLKQRIAGKPLPLDQILEQGAQIADALGAAHARGVIHRDIKPANVFITKEGSAKVLDFGLAKLAPSPARAGEGVSALPTLTADAQLSTSGAVVGTVAYMSPEQVRGEDLDARTDLFSFGAVLYEMASGRTPFTGDTTGVVFDSILNRTPLALSRLNPGLPPKLEEIIHKALEKDRDLRYQSAAELRSDLKRLKRDSESGVTGATTSAKHPVRRRVILPAATAFLLLAALIGVFVRYRYLHSIPPVDTNWQQLTFFTDSAVYPALSPDGRMLAFIRGDDPFITQGQVYVKLLPDGQPVELTRDSTSKLSPTFSPDGSRIAYGTVLPWDTWELPVLGGETHMLLPNASSLTWIEGGKRLLFSEIRDGIHMVVVTTDEGRGNSRDVYLPPGDRSMAHHSYLSPDGRWVLIVEMDPQGDLTSCRVAPFAGGGSPRVVGPPDGTCTGGAWSPDGKYVYVSAFQRDAFHIWRQRFPDGQPEQITSGPTSEHGIAMAPDGRSLITSVGSGDSTLWIHDRDGDHQLSSEGNARAPSFSSDGKSLYYLMTSGRTPANELWVRDLASEKTEKVLPGYSMDEYCVSRDGMQISFAMKDANARSNLWIAPTNRRSSPVRIASAAIEDSPFFLPDGDLVFRAVEGGSNFLYRMKTDGTGRRKITARRIFDLFTVSPDGRWLVAATKSANEGMNMIAAFPVDGGDPVPVCARYCQFTWDNTGKFLYIFFPASNEKGFHDTTYVLPVRPGLGLPKLPPAGLAQAQDFPDAKLAAVIPHVVDSAASPSLYAYVVHTTRRNLYRIPLQ